MKKTRMTEAVIGVAAGITVAVMVGKILPVNLVCDGKSFSTIAAMEECCGPYAQPCPEFKGTAE
ncbi:MAG: hypothetical protein PHO83_02790 [Geobacteraceae bacterium]|nr:hypothetical protein [Geobacteraceae bacterium]